LNFTRHHRKQSFQLLWNQMTNKINSIIEGTKGIFRMLQFIMNLKYVLCCGFLHNKTVDNMTFGAKSYLILFWLDRLTGEVSQYLQTIYKFVWFHLSFSEGWPESLLVSWLFVKNFFRMSWSRHALVCNYVKIILIMFVRIFIMMNFRKWLSQKYKRSSPSAVKPKPLKGLKSWKFASLDISTHPNLKTRRHHHDF
jgi:hypothetical protein